MDDPVDTAPRCAVCLVFCVRSSLRAVRRLAAEGHACPPLHPLTAWQALPPASLTGSACAWADAAAPLGADALHRPSARGRLPTLRALHQPGGCGGLWTPGGASGASARRDNALPGPPCRLGAGAAWWLSPRPRHEASPRGFRGLLLPDHVPTMTPRATHGASVSRVLATPPLPATHPQCGHRWHHTRLDRHGLHLRLAVTLAASCRNNARGEPRPIAGATQERSTCLDCQGLFYLCSDSYLLLWWPGSRVLHQRIEEGQQLAHTGDQGPLCDLPGCA